MRFFAALLLLACVLPISSPAIALAGDAPALVAECNPFTIRSETGLESCQPPVGPWQIAHHPAPPAPAIGASVPVVVPAPQPPSEASTHPSTPGHLLKLGCYAATVLAAAGAWHVLAARFVAGVAGVQFLKATQDGPDARGEGHDNAQALFACGGWAMGKG